MEAKPRVRSGENLLNFERTVVSPHEAVSRAEGPAAVIGEDLMPTAMDMAV
jgi:hypothetical protein